jgi:methylmalonyl-CoA mutase N-terminal domain/subunit
VDEVKEWRSSRDLSTVVESLDALAEVGRNPTASTTAAIVDAFDAGASMGECIGVLREVYGAPYDPLDRAAERPR